ncbi:hypothetical protein B9Z55_025596 [Caenorhabditis nigoni]|uniref:Uncharacterized protein n=1 Tax=Caenorhabditis nigoni TaxID=1611254 RepID=A0A2G5SZI2_9PELO|nr:hypothetical protein B9Z55_025596 [Caenorhabditis nigoni]
MDAAGPHPLNMPEDDLDGAPLILEAVTIVEEMHHVGREPRTANGVAFVLELCRDLLVLIRRLYPHFELFPAAA